jgi:RsiW-degrading membrane proteinase PrsW (M82 family)
MIYFVALFFGLAPGLIWLLFYLRKDAHPEPKKMILKIFFLGMTAALLAAAIEIIIGKGLNFINKNFTIPSFLFFILYYFAGIALIEELFKYLVVKIKVLESPDFDEPVDAMIYMIIAALGFATLENILVLFPGQETFTFLETTIVSSLRFAGATFLHALCSATIGFFLALSLLNPRQKTKLILSGLIISAGLHAFYNFSIMELERHSYFILAPITILTALAFFVSFGFRKLKKIKSVCEISENKKVIGD